VISWWDVLQPEMVWETVAIVKGAREQGVLVNLIINNRAGGNALMIAQEIAKKFLPENRSTSRNLDYSAKSEGNQHNYMI
jgi:hypothetical protein